MKYPPLIVRSPDGYPHPVRATLAVDMSDGTTVQMVINPGRPTGRLHVALQESECRRERPLVAPQLLADRIGLNRIDTHLRLDLISTDWGERYVLTYDEADPVTAQTVREFEVASPPDCCDEQHQRLL